MDGKNHNVLIYNEAEPHNAIFNNWSGEIEIYIDDNPIVMTDELGRVVKPIVMNGTTLFFSSEDGEEIDTISLALTSSLFQFA